MRIEPEVEAAAEWLMRIRHWTGDLEDAIPAARQMLYAAAKAKEDADHNDKE